MKTFYELIEETASFDFNDVVLNSKQYQYFYDEEKNPNRTGDKPYWLRRIYMQNNVLKWVHITDVSDRVNRAILMMDWRGVQMGTNDSNKNFFILPIGDMLGEDEFFQQTLVLDLNCIDYELYTKLYKFYHTVLLPIIHF